MKPGGPGALKLVFRAKPVRYKYDTPEGDYRGKCGVDHFEVDVSGKRGRYIGSDTMPAQTLAIASRSDTGYVTHIAVRVQRRTAATIFVEGPLRDDGWFTLPIANTGQELYGWFGGDSLDVGVLDGHGPGPEEITCKLYRFTDSGHMRD